MLRSKLPVGNVSVLRTGEGAVVVDTMATRGQGAAVLRKAKEITGEAVAVVINTHHHFDHTHGNRAVPGDATLIASFQARQRMADGGRPWQQALQSCDLPGTPFGQCRTIRLGGKTILVVHPGRGHTDGDLVVLFKEDRVLHAGDLYFHHRYPNIDLKAGGSVRAWAKTLDKVIDLPFDHVIPGHGKRVGDQADMEQFREFVLELANVSVRAEEERWTLEDTLESAELSTDAEYKSHGIPVLARLDRKFVLRRAWQEAASCFGYRDVVPNCVEVDSSAK